MEKLVVVEEGKENKKKEKGKEMIKRRYSLGIQNETVEKTDTQVKIKYTENITENTESSRNQVFRIDSQIIPKIKNNIRRLIMKSVLRNTL